MLNTNKSMKNISSEINYEKQAKHRNTGVNSNDKADISISSELQSQSFKFNNDNIEISSSLNKQTMRCIETRNSNRNTSNTLDTEIKSKSINSQSFYKSNKTSPKNGQYYATKVDIEELWHAIEYQDQTINKLITANNKLTSQLKETESKFEGKITDVQHNMSGINSNFEEMLRLF